VRGNVERGNNNNNNNVDAVRRECSERRRDHNN